MSNCIELSPDSLVNLTFYLVFSLIRFFFYHCDYTGTYEAMSTVYDVLSLTSREISILKKIEKHQHSVIIIVNIKSLHPPPSVLLRLTSVFTRTLQISF